MQEVVTVSVSQRANHLTTQFFNCQEENLYKSTPDNGLDPSIFLYPSIDKIAKSASYYPRALLWDAKYGNGSLGTYQYETESEDYHFNNHATETENNHQIVAIQKRINQSEYQKALDGNTPLPQLNKENTKYWSDYSRLVYQPYSFNCLQNWYHDTENPNIPDFKGLKTQRFTNYEQGVNEWKDCQDDFNDEHLRTALERCDSLQGFNLVTDMNTAWGTFSMSLLQDLRDEMPKTTIFTWGFFESDILTRGKQSIDNKYQVKNSILSSIFAMKECDLFFPLYSDPQLSNWEMGGQTCELFDAVNSVLANKDQKKRKHMTYFVDCLTDGEPKRNMVSKMVNDDRNMDYSYVSRVTPYKKRGLAASKDYYEFSYLNIRRGTTSKEQEPKDTTTKKDAYRNVETTAYCPSSTIPDQFKENTTYSLKLSSSEKNRDLYKHWSDYVSRYFRYDDEREELKDDLENLISAYEYGWYSDEDSGDD